MDVSIVMPFFKPDGNITRKIFDSLKRQKFSGKKEIIIVEGGGLAENMNRGIRKSKYDFVVTLHQDCIPKTDKWLENLVLPFKDKKVVATVSKITLPNEIWNGLGAFTKSMMLQEKGTIRPLLDEKACGYRKSALKKVGYFDSKSFRTAGEDFDIYLKLKKQGNIAYPEAEVIHYHPSNFPSRLRKVRQWSNGYGALVRIYGKEMHRWYIGVLKAIPIVGWVMFAVSYPFRKNPALYPFYLLTTPLLHIQYIRGFWKGFLMGKQTV